jgi:hypothetical protein
MQYKSEIQRQALQKQGRYLQSFNEQSKKVKGDDIQKVKDLYLSGVSTNQIAKLFGCSKNPVLKIIKNLPKNDFTKYKHRNCYKQFGPNNPHWKGGIKSIYDRIRGLKAYWDWHHKVLYRDSHKCASCSCINDLQIHHLKTLKSLILEYCRLNAKQIQDLTEQDLNNSFFYELSNGITLCEDCHKKWHKDHGRR